MRESGTGPAGRVGMAAQHEREPIAIALLAIADRIVSRCRELKLSRAKLCGQAGLHQDCIRTIEGGHEPRISRLRAIERALQLPRASLIDVLLAALDREGSAASYPRLSES